MEIKRDFSLVNVYGDAIQQFIEKVRWNVENYPSTKKEFKKIEQVINIDYFKSKYLELLKFLL